MAEAKTGGEDATEAAGDAREDALETGQAQAGHDPSGQEGAAPARTAVMELRVPFVRSAQPWTQRLQVPGWDSALNARYADALIGELEANADEFADVEVQAVRLGGGQASHLGGDNVWRVMRAVRRLFRLAPGAPVSMRCSQGDVSGASMPLFRRSGIGRLDLEMLTLDQASFHRVNPDDSLELYPILCNTFLHSYANDSLGLVLLAGSPLARDIEARRSFLEARNYHAAHVIVERYEGEGADPARTQAQAACAREILEAAGLHEYLPLRFARPGCEDRFFQAREAGSDVLGFGLGARTRFDGALSTNTSDMETYLEHSRDFTQITASVEPAGGGAEAPEQA